MRTHPDQPRDGESLWKSQPLESKQRSDQRAEPAQPPWSACPFLGAGGLPARLCPTPPPHRGRQVQGEELSEGVPREELFLQVSHSGLGQGRTSRQAPCMWVGTVLVIGAPHISGRAPMAQISLPHSQQLGNLPPDVAASLPPPSSSGGTATNSFISMACRSSCWQKQNLCPVRLSCVPSRPLVSPTPESELIDAQAGKQGCICACRNTQRWSLSAFDANDLEACC